MRIKVVFISLFAFSLYAADLRPIAAAPPGTTSVLVLQAEKELLQAQNLALQTQIMVMRAEHKLAEVRAQEEAKKGKK